MKNMKVFLVVILIFTMGFGLIACGKKVNLETEADAIKYLKNYIEEEDKWEHIANKLGVRYTSGKTEFYSSSYAQQKGDEWTVVLHGVIPGSVFSYIAAVSADGKVTELGIVAGLANNVH